MGKLPYIQLYTGDWLKDPVSGCSLAAQMLWMRIMFVAHDSARYGYLVNSDGSPIPPGSIAQRCGCTLEQYEALLTELDSVGVPSRTPTGILYSRRMVRDAKARRAAAKRKENERKAQTGKAGNSSKKKEEKICHADVTAMSQGSSSSSSVAENLRRRAPPVSKPPDSVDNSKRPAAVSLKREMAIRILRISELNVQAGRDAMAWVGSCARLGVEDSIAVRSLSILLQTLERGERVKKAWGLLDELSRTFQKQQQDHEYKHGDLTNFGAIMRQIGIKGS